MAFSPTPDVTTYAIKPVRLSPWPNPVAGNRWRNFGQPFHGRTIGTRKAMRSAAKRRRMNAKLPKR